MAHRDETVCPQIRVLASEWDIYAETARRAHDTGLIYDQSVTALLALAIERHLPIPRLKRLDNELCGDRLRPPHAALAEQFPNEEIRRVFLELKRRDYRRMRTLGVLAGVAADTILMSLIAALVDDLREERPDLGIPRLPFRFQSFRNALEAQETQRAKRGFHPVKERVGESSGVTEAGEGEQIVQWNFYLPEDVWPGDLRTPDQYERFTALLDDALPPLRDIGDAETPARPASFMETARRIAASPYPEDCKRSRKRLGLDWRVRQRIDAAAAFFSLERHDLLFAVVTGSVNMPRRRPARAIPAMSQP